MQRLIKTFGLFLVFSLVFYVVALVLWTHLVPLNFFKKNAAYPLGEKGFTRTRILEVDTVKNIDILFLGSSHAYRGFDTRIYTEQGLRVFNLGSPSQTPLQTHYLIKNHLEQLNPQLVIYDVYPATFQNDGVESSLDLLANAPMDEGLLKMVLEVNHLKTYNTLIYDGFRELLQLNKGYRESKKKGDATYISGGFVESAIMYNENPLTEAAKERWEPDRWLIQDKQWVAFSEVLELLKSHNTDFWLVQMPVTSPAFNLYKNNTEIDSLFQTCGPYYNLNTRMPLNDSIDFIDYHHLSQSGVRATNKALLKLIQTKGVFPKE